MRAFLFKSRRYRVVEGWVNLHVFSGGGDGGRKEFIINVTKYI
jgi:hypothetical protein